MSKRDKSASPAQAARQTAEQAATEETQPQVPEVTLGEVPSLAAAQRASQQPEQEPSETDPAAHVAAIERQLAQASEAPAGAAEQLRARDEHIDQLERRLAQASEALVRAAEQLRARDERIAELEQQLTERATASSPAVVPSTSVRPDAAALKAAWKAGKRVEVTYLGADHYALVAGLNVDSTPRVFKLGTVFDCGQSHVRALAVDPTISVRIVD